MYFSLRQKALILSMLEKASNATIATMDMDTIEEALAALETRNTRHIEVSLYQDWSDEGNEYWLICAGNKQFCVGSNKEVAISKLKDMCRTLPHLKICLAYYHEIVVSVSDIDHSAENKMAFVLSIEPRDGNKL